MALCESDSENLKDRIEFFKVIGKYAEGFSDVLCHSNKGCYTELVMRFNIKTSEWEKAMNKFLDKKVSKLQKLPPNNLSIADGKVEGAGSSDSPFPVESKKKRTTRIPLHTTLDGE